MFHEKILEEKLRCLLIVSILLGKTRDDNHHRSPLWRRAIWKSGEHRFHPDWGGGSPLCQTNLPRCRIHASTCKTNDLCKMTVTSNFDSDILAKKINLVTHIDILQNALCTCLYHLYSIGIILPYSIYVQEIVHLDLKPENIMLCRRDSNRWLKHFAPVIR